MRLRPKFLGALAPLALSFVTAALPARGAPPDAAPTPAPTVAPVTPPKLLSESAVAYPDGAKGDATVVLTLTINADGTVRSASPSKPNEPFSSQAVGAALGWTFAPAIRNGRPRCRQSFDSRWCSTRRRLPKRSPNRRPAPAPRAPPKASHRARPRRLPSPRWSSAANAPSRRARPRSSRAEVRQIPGTFGDPFRAIEMMPGVTPIVSGLPFFFVRGAPPGQRRLLPRRHPRPAALPRRRRAVGRAPRRSSSASISTRAATRRASAGSAAASWRAKRPRPVRELHGEYNVRLFDAGALVETPFADDRGSVLARRPLLVHGRAALAPPVRTSSSTTGTTRRASAYDLTPRRSDRRLRVRLVRLPRAAAPPTADDHAVRHRVSSRRPALRPQLRRRRQRPRSR